MIYYRYRLYKAFHCSVALVSPIHMFGKQRQHKTAVRGLYFICTSVPTCSSLLSLPGGFSLAPCLCNCCWSHCRALNVFQMKLQKQQLCKISIKAHRCCTSKGSPLLNHISSIDFCAGLQVVLSLSPNEFLTPGWPQHYSMFHSGHT